MADLCRVFIFGQKMIDPLCYGVFLGSKWGKSHKGRVYFSKWEKYQQVTSGDKSEQYPNLALGFLGVRSDLLVVFFAKKVFPQKLFSQPKTQFFAVSSQILVFQNFAYLARVSLSCQ